MPSDGILPRKVDDAVIRRALLTEGLDAGTVVPDTETDEGSERNDKCESDHGSAPLIVVSDRRPPTKGRSPCVVCQAPGGMFPDR